MDTSGIDTARGSGVAGPTIDRPIASEFDRVEARLQEIESIARDTNRELKRTSPIVMFIFGVVAVAMLHGLSEAGGTLREMIR